MSRTILPLAAFLVFAPIAAQATISRAVAFEEKVDDAASIVVGRLVNQQSRWDDSRRNIVTYSTFRIEKTLKGAPAQEVTLVTPGGTVGNIAQEIIGVPEFRPSEDHLLFVRNTPSGPTVAFLEQGDYRVSAEARGDRIVTPTVSSAVLVDTGRGTAVTPEQPRTLREFEKAVRDRVRQKETIRMEMALRQQKQQASFWNQIQRNALLVVVALLGVVLASWQIYKRW